MTARALTVRPGVTGSLTLGEVSEPVPEEGILEVERIGQRAFWQPRIVAITGAGPVGLLAAFLGVQRGLQVHVVDRGPEARHCPLARWHLSPRLAAEFRPAGRRDNRMIIECTGVPRVVIDVMTHGAPDVKVVRDLGESQP